MINQHQDGWNAFLHPTNPQHDLVLHSFEKRYGNHGYAFYFKMQELLYRNPRLEIVIPDDHYLELLADMIGVDLESFYDMLEHALNQGFFDRKLYQQRKLLTSFSFKESTFCLPELYRSRVRQTDTEPLEENVITRMVTPIQEGWHNFFTSKSLHTGEKTTNSLTSIETDGSKPTLPYRMKGYFSEHFSKLDRLEIKSKLSFFKGKLNGQKLKQVPSRFNGMIERRLNKDGED